MSEKISWISNYHDDLQLVPRSKSQKKKISFRNLMIFRPKPIVVLRTELHRIMSRIKITSWYGTFWVIIIRYWLIKRSFSIGYFYLFVFTCWSIHINREKTFILRSWQPATVRMPFKLLKNWRFQFLGFSNYKIKFVSSKSVKGCEVFDYNSANLP